jgi:acetyl/propionyl-CoA carboxylase alpha subunit
MTAAFTSARSEARHAFGDPALFVERRLAAARHVEVQVIADDFGTVWAVGVRDCSVQRRNQKVMEESGCTLLDEAAEQILRDAAVGLCAAAGYRGAGTVEFLLDPVTKEFMFIEVNTRLQVEHPVTEMTTGLDLVKLQLHVARGKPLAGDPPPTRGYAIEARRTGPGVRAAPADRPWHAGRHRCDRRRQDRPRVRLDDRQTHCLGP